MCWSARRLFFSCFFFLAFPAMPRRSQGTSAGTQASEDVTINMEAEEEVIEVDGSEEEEWNFDLKRGLFSPCALAARAPMNSTFVASAPAGRRVARS